MLSSTSELCNGLRYRSQPQWFDFYNLRVVLPHQGKFFFIIPYLLSGTEVKNTGLTVYDGGNGSPDGVAIATSTSIGGGWAASPSSCEVRWGESNHLTASSVRCAGPTTKWNLTLRPFLTDTTKPIHHARRYDLVERMLLRYSPFVHRVPRMKGWADGWIEQNGQRWEVESAPVYQAKNHGRHLPERWIWIHANAFEEDESIAFEAAYQPGLNGTPMGLVRIARPGGVRELLTWTGADVSVVHRDGRFEVEAQDERGCIRGVGSATEFVQFTVPDPRGEEFVITECLTGTLKLEFEGQRFTTNIAALGYANLHKLGLTS